MGNIYFSNGIVVTDRVFDNQARAKQGLGPDGAGGWGKKDLVLGDWAPFRDATMDALRAISAFPIGREMIEDINASRQLVTIGGSRAEILDKPREPQLGNACFTPEAQPQFYHPINTPASLTEVLQKAADHLTAGAGHLAVQEKLFEKLQELVEKSCDLKWAVKTHPWTQDWRVLRVEINGTSEAFLKYALEAFLTRGDGAPATIRWHPESTQFQTEMSERVHAKREQGEAIGSGFIGRPPFIALAHELIHGWRAVTGRYIFNAQDLLHDEHMTVGLLPRTVTPQKTYTGMHQVAASGVLALLRSNAISNRYTENRIRSEAKMPLRPLY